MTPNASPVGRGETRASSRGLAATAAPLLLAAALSILSFVPARAATPRVHAIVGARIVTAPGKVIPRGTIVLRDGVITAVGASVAVPADARVWEGDSLTVYPGLIDAFVLAPEPKGAAAPSGGGGGRPSPSTVTPRGAQHELAAVRPETRALDALPLEKDLLESLRGAGFATVQLAPRRGVVRGRSAVVNLGDGGASKNLLRDEASQVLSLESMREGYPGSLMGGVAVIRQALLDARWYRDVHTAYDKSPQGQSRPDENVAWEALSPVVSGRQTALFLAVRCSRCCAPRPSRRRRR